jgi:DNA-directed RNA polymerase II subunit RPB2
MVNRLLRCYLGLRPLDDRDSYVNKRLDTPGVLLANLFRQYFGKVVKDIRTLIQKDINGGSWRATNKFVNVVNKSNVYKLIKQTIIEQGLKYGLATGNWGVKTSRVRQGVAQVLNRMTYIATLSHMRRVNTPIEKTGKLVQPRKLHPTQWGVVCPAETPEGASVGLVKNLALLTNITVATPSDPVRSALDELGLVRFDPEAPPSAVVGVFSGDAPTRVLINGDLIGSHGNPVELVRDLRRLKRSGALSVFTSVAWGPLAREVSICTEGGRFVRPLLVVDPDTGAPAIDQASFQRPPRQVFSGLRPQKTCVGWASGGRAFGISDFVCVFRTDGGAGRGGERRQGALARPRALRRDRVPRRRRDQRRDGRHDA